ncbi:DUF4437 domain-containing protein [Rhodobacteraceae bacterium NNCM2]|nr:DUF4437 domain-containing protein [Coraliihabitans acroporae]
MKIRPLFPAAMIAAATLTSVATAEPIVEVVSREELTLQPLNPLRGDASPKAGVLWGDIRQDVPSGAILQFADGFSSPPHIHNITYRAVVISGELYNGGADATKVWMGPGSFWTQPAGEPHITAAATGGATAFLEILEGPYLVQPTDKSFDNGERPLNLEASNIVWLEASDVNWINQAEGDDGAQQVEMAFPWGKPVDGGTNGTFLKLPKGYSGELRGNESWLRAVVIKGEATHKLPGDAEAKTLEPGNYFGSKGDAAHQVSCDSEDACVLYVRTDGKYTLSAL